MSFTFQFKRGTASEAATANIVLAAGEIGIETDTRKFKIGDGVTPWNSLLYSVSDSSAPSFAQIAVAGELDVVPTTPNDTLTFVAGTNITIDTNPTTKEITFNSTATGGGGGTSVAVLDEGTSLTAAATSLNFVGAGVTATNTGSSVTVTIPGATGGGSSGGIQTYIFDPPVKDGTVDYTKELEAAIRLANGLSADGTGTISNNPAYVYCMPGKYLVRFLNPSTAAAGSTTTNSGTLVNGNNTLTLDNAAGFSTGSNLAGKLYTNQGVFEGRFSRSSGSNTVTFVPGQTGVSFAGLTFSVGARFEQVGVGLNMLLAAEPGTVTFMYYCNESAFFNIAAINNMTAGTIRKTVRSVSIGPALDYFPSGDDTVCSVINIDDTTGINPGDLCVITAGNPLPYNNQDRVGEAFRVQNVDGNNVYTHGPLEYHYVYEAFGTTSIGLNLIPKTAVKVDLEGINFMGAPTLLGIDVIPPNQTALNSDGSPNNVLGPQRPATITVSGTTATVTTEVPHGLIAFVSSPRVDGNKIYIQGANQAGFNIYATVTGTPTSTTFTYTVASGLSNPTGNITWRVVADCHSTINEGRALSLSYAPYMRIRNCEAFYPWAAFIRNAYCPFTRIENCNYTHASNALSSTDAKARLGYGVYCYGWSSHTVVDGGTWTGGRHMLTTASPARSAWSVDEWVYQGQPTNVLVTNTVSVDAYGVPYDTHEEASLTTFKNVVAINPARGHDGGSYAGCGVHLRGRRSRLMDYYQRGGTQGIRYIGDAEGRVFAEPKPRPVTALRPTALTWPLSGATVPLWSTDGFASSGTVYIEQQAGSGVYIQCTYSNRTTSGGVPVLTGVTSVGGTGSLQTGAFVRQANISSITVSGSVATVTTTANHGFVTGQTDVILRIRDADQAGYNITAVATITGANTFTYPLVTTNDNSQTVAIPTVSATGSFINWQDWSQYPTHVFQNVFIEDISSRDDSSQAIILENCSNALKTEVRGSGLRVRNVPRAVTCGTQTRLHLDDITAARVKGRVIDTSTGAYVNVRKVYLDSAYNASMSATALVPFYFSGTGVQIHIGEFDLMFGRGLTNASAANPVSLFDGAASGNYTYSLGRLKLRDYHSTQLTPTVCPVVVPITSTSTFNFAGGGEVLRIPAYDPVVTNTLKTIGQMGHIGRFLITRAVVITDVAAVGNITVDVLRNGSSIFGASKINVPAGSTTSVTGAAPTLVATSSLIDTDASLTITAVSSSAGETAKIYGVALLGYYVA